MAEDGQNFGILQDLQVHLRTAKIPVENLSTLAQEGDEQKSQKYVLDSESLKLIEQFLTENIKLEGNGPDVIQSQLYIACFWGIKDVVDHLLRNKTDVNRQNKLTLWTPLHAATFQEYGPIVMLLLEYGAKPDSPDSVGRTPIDFASASDKIWPHFAALGCKRVSRAELVEKRVLRPSSSQFAGRKMRVPGQGIQMASYDRAESKYEYNSDPFIQAAVTGDVLADQGESSNLGSTSSNPQFSMWR
ncbi:ankyrin repeat domain-containing protein 54-like isoform X1 [Mercenaria mercenaria]|uniref:ankyrin repeat domain-containing protein 54-like isoform X1 n=1 Tax=Mercenaria mercenaria TaxID=6596 RepID=UPI00234F10E0|nr:ankyrin repeat domain-containing protein 54-like isoform X1 [Mercenaria mercenaria]